MSTGSHWLGERASLTLLIIVILNVIDAYLTAGWMQLGVIEEANPLMATLLDHGPVVFLNVKFAIVCLGCILLYRRRFLIDSQVGMTGALVVYLWVMTKHYEVWRLIDKYGIN